MNIDDFDYHLPQDRIAAYPCKKRDQSNLMRLNVHSGFVKHYRFEQLEQLLRPDDILVINNSRVFKARVRGHKPTGGKVEILVLELLGDQGKFRALVGTSKALKVGGKIEWPLPGACRVEQVLGEGIYDFSYEGDLPLDQALEMYGEIPLPPYILAARESKIASGMGNRTGDDTRDQAQEEFQAKAQEQKQEQLMGKNGDRERYQCVYARPEVDLKSGGLGSVAAPTAGFHFTPDLMTRLEKVGVEKVEITLHVGPGTFLPVRTRDLKQHQMHEEILRFSAESAQRLCKAQKAGQRIVAVGTTCVRALESMMLRGGFQEGIYRTDLFVYPGFKFQAVGAMITNFHLPKSTLLLLVSAFAGWEKIRLAYQEAVDKNYRFYSYGDAMLIE